MKPITNQAVQLFHEGSIALSQVECNGIRIDTDYLNRAIKMTTRRVNKLTRKLKEDEIYAVWKKTYGSKTNIQSRNQLADIIFNIRGHKCIYMTKGGKPQANEDALKSTGLDFVQNYLEVARLKKAKSTYLEGILRETHNGFMHPFFNLHIPRSFRSSCDHPNFQNIPIKQPEIAKLIRRAFIARGNHRIVEVDFKGAEICAAACYHHDPQMIKYIKNPKLDMHRDMAAEIFMISKDQVYKWSRDSAKNRFVFAEFYGDWYITRAADLWKSIDELKLVVGGTDIDLYSHLKSMGIYELGDCNPDEEPREGTFEKHIKEIEKDFWNKRFKVYNQWKKDWYSDYLRDGYFDLLTGFRIDNYLERKQVINTPIQGVAFHWLLWSLIKIQKIMTKYKMKSLIVGQIHDSIIGDIHKDELGTYLEICKEVIYNDLPRYYNWICVPLKVEVEAAQVGESWHDKKEVEL